jgi:hypothetical protein
MLNTLRIQSPDDPHPSDLRAAIQRGMREALRNYNIPDQPIDRFEEVFTEVWLRNFQHSGCMNLFLAISAHRLLRLVHPLENLAIVNMEPFTAGMIVATGPVGSSSPHVDDEDNDGFVLPQLLKLHIEEQRFSLCGLYGALTVRYRGDLTRVPLK